MVKKIINLIIIMTLLSFYSCYIHHKKYVVVPKKDFLLDKKILRSDGYYYTETTRTSYCRRLQDGSRTEPAQESEYEGKGISYLFLYKDGYLFSSGMATISGTSYTDENYNDYCYLLDSLDTFQSARDRLEESLKRGIIGEDEGAYKKNIFQRGVYSIDGRNIKLQHYYGTGGGPNLVEYHGEILSDTTFVIQLEKSYESQSKERLEILYKFKKFSIKPDSTNYIRDNRNKFGKK